LAPTRAKRSCAAAGGAIDELLCDRLELGDPPSPAVLLHGDLFVERRRRTRGEAIGV